ncbi:GpE family phage tail protein [Comamonas testosteroni]|nr:GpE family phage tail protein [Comamonas testosteroni]
MADIAIIFHWPLSELWPMSLEELMDWRGRAVELHNKINAPPE